MGRVLLVFLLSAIAAPAYAQHLARTGPQKVAVIVAKYSHTPDDFRTIDEIPEAVFTGERSASAWFKEASYGKVWLVGKARADGDIYGPVTLPFDDTNCLGDLTRAYEMSLQLAQPMGFEAAAYDKVIVNLPASDVCGEKGGGRAEVGGRRIWMHGRSSAWVFAHELLHSYGFHHANGWTCRAGDNSRVSLGGTCSSSDRADRTDIMGSANQYKHLGAYLKSLLGWIPAANVREVTRSGMYTLAPVEIASDGVQNLRIPYGVVDGQERVIDLDFRQPVGFSGRLMLQSYGGSAFETALLSGVYLRIAPRDPRRYAGSSVNMIDIDPTASGLEPLLPGQSFADPAGRFRISVVSADGNGARLNIEVQEQVQQFDGGVPQAQPDASPRMDALSSTSDAAPVNVDATTVNVDAAAAVVDAPSSRPDASVKRDTAVSAPQTAPPTQSSGCGCRVDRGRSPSVGWLTLLVALGFSAARAARRRKRAGAAAPRS